MNKLSYCGNDCSVCPRYTATEKGDIPQLKGVADLWFRVGWRDKVVSPEEIKCYGCLTSNFCRYGIQQCASSKEVDDCGMCPSYPCEISSKTFIQTQKYADSIKDKCSNEEYLTLQLAFFQKKMNLDGLHSK
ncbi:DUF3795 domain-containing protein [Desulfosporosinus sp. FKA]|uniref:DUF3795 domain-containing protein n=1 Tax=Desulfosporosinus sp. FKA TaxID=1969834 RepID=UPI000B49BBD8|nr:DUF3795 domain-containing protein [Desulfosporosinus sp. FKA]